MRSRFDLHFILQANNPTWSSGAEIERRGTCVRCLMALRDCGGSVFEADRVFLAVVDVYQRRSPTVVSESGILLKRDASAAEWRDILGKVCERMEVDPALLSALTSRPHGAGTRYGKKKEGDPADERQPGERPTSGASGGSAKTTDGIGWAVSLPHSSTPR
jgi:hypothetical protein